MAEKNPALLDNQYRDYENWCEVCGISIPDGHFYCGDSCEKAAFEMDPCVFEWNWYEYIEYPPYVLQRCYGEFGW